MLSIKSTRAACARSIAHRAAPAPLVPRRFSRMVVRSTPAETLEQVCLSRHPRVCVWLVAPGARAHDLATARNCVSEKDHLAVDTVLAAWRACILPMRGRER